MNGAPKFLYIQGFLESGVYSIEVVKLFAPQGS
jgi:hypothetical protein